MMKKRERVENSKVRLKREDNKTFMEEAEWDNQTKLNRTNNGNYDYWQTLESESLSQNPARSR